MSNAPASPLDLAFKEQLNQLNQFGETMMNRINDRVDRLLERLTPITKGDNPGVINVTPLEGVERQEGIQPPNGGTVQPIGEPPLQPEFGPLPPPGEGEVVPQKIPQANLPPVEPLIALRTP